MAERARYGGHGLDFLYSVIVAEELARTNHTGLAAPLRQGETVLASGRGPSDEVTLNGGELPVGELVLRLAVQDVAGWVNTRAVTVTNAGAVAGPTPTPWNMATATPWR